MPSSTRLYWLLFLPVTISPVMPLSPLAHAQDTPVYSDHTIPSHWSEPAVGADAEGKSFHGPFGNQNVALTLDHLPKHRWVKMSFDLYVIGSWDGSSAVWGPDLWSLSVRGAQRLIFTSFCAWGYSGNDEQSYPDDYPQAIHPAWTGVQARNVVNIKDSDPPKNGVYKVEVLFPHTDDQLILDFAGSYQDPPAEQQIWAVGNVEAHALTEETLTEADTLPWLWEKLADNDNTEANKALWQFIGAGTAGTGFIQEKVDQMSDETLLSEADGLRLHRAHRIVRIIGGKGSGGLCFKMDRLSLEYARKYLGK